MCDETKYVESLMKRSRKAFASYEFTSQEEVDFICATVAYTFSRTELATRIANLAFEETGLGNAVDKCKKFEKIRAVYADMKGQVSAGIIKRDIEEGIVEFAKPIGVIGALIPCTNPEMTPVIKSLWALKTRNSIILSPHPRALKTNMFVAEKLRQILKTLGYDEDLVIAVNHVNMEVSNQVLKQCDIALATGGKGLVQAAYSSGKPAYGVGVGNAYSIVDHTVDLAYTADLIMKSKINDNASGCSSDNGALIEECIYNDMVAELQNVGGYFIKNESEDKKKLQECMWDDRGVLNRNVVAQSALKIAHLAGLEVPENTKFIMVEEDGYGENHPFSKEKLSPVLTLMKWNDPKEVPHRINAITGFCGAGHSCCVHSNDEGLIQNVAEIVRVSRVTVRQAHGLSNSGAWSNGLKNTCTLGCGTWGGNIVSENVYFKHLLNVTRLSYPLNRMAPSDLDLFGKETIEKIQELDKRS
jgi:sulfoacetaldehyde dehydrogenase